MAADKGHIVAMKIYGLRLSERRGISKNEKEACRHFKNAADNRLLRKIFFFWGAGTYMSL